MSSPASAAGPPTKTARPGAGPLEASPFARTGGDAGSGLGPGTLAIGTSQSVCLIDDMVREGWAEFLGRYGWDVFATLTYRGSAWSSEQVVRNFKAWLFRWQLLTAIERGLCAESVQPRRDAYGREVGTSVKRRGTWWNGYRKGRAFPVWVLGVEPQKSGKLHAHAIIKWSCALPGLSRWTGWHLWTGARSEGGFDHGFARIEPPRCQGDVAGYVSKYVVKGGELYLSPSFDAARLAAV